MASKAVAIPVYILKRWGIHIFIVGVSIFLLLLVHRKVYECFLQDSRYSIGLDAFNLANCPNWMLDEQLKESVTTSLNCTIKTSIFDENLIPKLREHYEGNPWVKEVRLIERRLPNDLKINLEMRRPYVAKMRNSRGVDNYYLVDKDSVRLPGEYKALPAMPMTLPILTGVRTNPPAAGEMWDDNGLNSAINIVARLESNKLLEPLQLSQIDVANVGGKRNQRETEIVLYTRNRVRIEWGRSPDTDKFGELSVDDKIKNIKLVLDVCPELKGIKYVKVQFDQPYIALEK